MLNKELSASRGNQTLVETFDNQAFHPRHEFFPAMPPTRKLHPFSNDEERTGWRIIGTVICFGRVIAAIFFSGHGNASRRR
jgi:hypothetical protein